MKINDVDYHVEITGEPQPVWLLLHGFMGSSADFNSIIPHLSGQIIAPDLLGHGRSQKVQDGQRYDIARQAADLVQMLQKLEIKTPINLVGYSMGGRLALYLTEQYPNLFRQVILESSTAGLQTEKKRAERRAQDEQKARALLAEGLPAFVDDWQELPLFASQKTLPMTTKQHIRQQRLQQNPAALAASLVGMGTGAMPNLWEKLARIKLPVTFIAGKLDLKFQQIMTEMNQQLPDSRLVVVEQAGHNVHLEQPQQFIQILQELS